MKKFCFAVAVSIICFPVFGQNLNANQVRLNSTVFTIGTNTYDADYNLIFNRWYRGHKNAEEARQGEDVSWVNDFTRTYTLDFQEGILSIGDNALGSVKVIKFSRSGGMRDRFGDIGMLSMQMWLVYDSTTGRLTGAQLDIGAYNAYYNIGPTSFDLPEFTFPLRVERKNAPISTINTGSGLVSYKNVYEYITDSSTRNGVSVCIYNVNSTVAQKLKEADDFAKTTKRDIPSLMGRVEQSAAIRNATHRLTADLNVFTEQDGGSRIVASLKSGDLVQFLEYGAYADWNGITARWAKVKTGDDKTGWLFSGFLEEIRR